MKITEPDFLHKKILQNHVNHIKKFLAAKNIFVPFYICGGAVFSIINNDHNYSDLDVFFTTETDKLLIKDTFKNIGTFTSNNAITFNEKQNSINVNPTGLKWNHIHTLQFILRHSGKLKEIFNNFDFNCCRCAYTSDGELIIDSSYDINISFNPKRVSAAIVVRYIKYTTIKPGKDKQQKTKYAIFDELIKNLFSTFTNYYGSCALAGYKIIDNSLTECDVSMVQYIHDEICDRSTVSDKHKIFEKMPILLYTQIKNPSLELNTQRLKKQLALEEQSSDYNDDVVFADGDSCYTLSVCEVTKEERSRVLDEYPELFI